MARAGPAFRTAGSLGEPHKTPIVPFPRSYKSLKMLYSLGSTAGKFILTSGRAPFRLGVASQSALCVCLLISMQCYPDLSI